MPVANAILSLDIFGQFWYMKSGSANSLIMKIAAKENDTNDILQTFR